MLVLAYYSAMNGIKLVMFRYIHVYSISPAISDTLPILVIHKLMAASVV